VIEHFDLGDVSEFPAEAIEHVGRYLKLTDEQRAALSRNIVFRSRRLHGTKDDGLGQSEIRAALIAAADALCNAKTAVALLPVPLRERLIAGYQLRADAVQESHDWTFYKDQSRSDLAALERMSDAALWAVQSSPEPKRQHGPAKSPETMAASIAIAALRDVLGRGVHFGKRDAMPIKGPSSDFITCRMIMCGLIPIAPGDPEKPDVLPPPHPAWDDESAWHAYSMWCDGPLWTAHKTRVKPEDIAPSDPEPEGTGLHTEDDAQ
jgi:hypothetical protein